MILKKFTYSILNLTSVKNNIMKKKNYLLTILLNGNYQVQKLLQFTEKKSILSFTKTRKNVQGSGKKPWKQKGTGKSRIGSLRSPLCRGGGSIFGPKAKIIYKHLNKKEKHLIFQTLIYNKRFNFLIFNELTNNLKLLLIKNPNILTLIILETKTIKFKQFIRNFTNYSFILVTQLSIKHLLNQKRIILSYTSLNQIIINFLDKND